MVTGSPETREAYYRAMADTLPPETLVVTSLGNASYLWAAIHDRPGNFYVEDAMGLALPLAFGLAVARPDRQVVVVEGDGGLLMHLGGLITVGAAAPPNLTVLLIRNGVHAASGGQALTNADLDFAALARAAGLKSARNIETAQALGPALAEGLGDAGPTLLALATAPDLEVVVPPAGFDPVVTKRRFQDAIEAPRYLPTLFGGGRLEERR